jgi:PAS domain S-box-containing protein
MKKPKPTYEELEARLAIAEPIVEALRSLEVDAVIGKQKLTFLLLKEVGDELLHSQAGYNALFALPGVGMMQADSPSFRFTKVNETFCEMLGYSAEYLMGKTYLELTDPRDRVRDMKVMSKIIRGKAPLWNIEKRCVHKDGTVIWVMVHGATRCDDSGHVVRIIATVRDVTDSKPRDRGDRMKRLQRASGALKDVQRDFEDESSEKPRKNGR